MKQWIIPYIKQYKGRMFLTIVFGLLGIISAVMLLFISGYLISKSALRPENIMVVYVPIVSVRAFSIGQALFPYLERLLSHDIVLTILAKYRRHLYDILEPQAMFLQGRYQTGDLLSVLSDDIETLQDFYIRTLFPSLVGLVIYTLFIAVIGLFDWIFMLLVIALLGVIVFFIPFISYLIMKKYYQRKQTAKGSLYRLMTDAMFGQLDLLISRRVNTVIEQTLKMNEAYLLSEQKIQHWHHIRNALLRFVSIILILSLMIWSSMQVEESVFSPTMIAAFVLMAFSLTDALLPLSDAVEEIPVYEEATWRMNQLTNITSVDQTHQTTKLLTTPTIEFSNVSFRYSQAAPWILKDLSLTIQPGEKIAILGRSGAGKSTLLKLASGILSPTRGEIRLNGRKVNQGDLAKNISVLNQKPHLFHTTVANNVRIGRQTATVEEVIQVLEKTQMMSLINDLPKGIHTSMEEMGKRFSGGERQRIAFARILLQDTPIIFMDEPTTGLDVHTEKELIETVLQAASNQTIFWVTHRLTGAQYMDRIIFLKDGQINFSGSHEELYQSNEYYRTLFQMDYGLIQGNHDNIF